MPHWEQPFDPENAEEMRQETYEAAAVKYILKKYKPHEQRSVGRELSLDVIEQLTDFPLRLRTRKMRNISTEMLMQLQLAPTKSRIVEAFNEVLEELPEAAESGRAGLIFNWPGWSKFMLFHLWDTTTYRIGSRWIWYPGRKHRPHILETLDSFLDAIKE